MIEAIVNQNKPDTWYLHVSKKEGEGLPNKDGKRVPIQLKIGEQQFLGHIGSRHDYPYIYISPGLFNQNTGMKFRMKDVLQENGIEKGDRVHLSISGNQIIVRKK